MILLWKIDDLGATDVGSGSLGSMVSLWKTDDLSVIDAGSWLLNIDSVVCLAALKYSYYTVSTANSSDLRLSLIHI